MTHENFKKLLDELDGNASDTLAEKNARYSSSDDALHNFKAGAEIMGGTPAQACWGYLTKHLTALRDMIQRNDFSNRDDFLEKIQDSMNYLRFIWALGNKDFEDKFIGTNDDLKTCHDCVYMTVSDDNFPCNKCKGTISPDKDEKEYKTRLNYCKKS